MATGGASLSLPASIETSYKLQLTKKSATSPGELYRSRVWENLRELFYQDHLTDVMLAAEGQSIPCHKMLLAAASKFFCDKFITNPESLEHNILDIEHIDFDTLTSVVTYIYSGDIELTVTKTEKLLPASVSLMLPELTKECKTFLGERNSNISDCIAVYYIAKDNSLENTANEAWENMLDNFQDIIRTNAFKELSETELQKYIGDKDLKVGSGEPMFEAVVSWVRHDMDNRKDRFPTLLEHVTLSHCSIDFLNDVAMQEPLMRNVDGSMYRIFEALASQARPLQLGALGEMDHGNNSLLAICLMHGKHSYNYSLQCWVLTGGATKWLKKTAMAGDIYIGPFTCVSICRVRDGILITGNGSLGNMNKKLSLPTLNCTDVSGFNVPRYYHASVFVGGRAYVLGGHNNGALNCVEYLDEKTGSWCATTDLPIPLAEHTAVDYKHFIYVFGGAGIDRSRTWSKATFAFSTVSKTWSRKANMPQYCTKGCSAVYKDRIYVLGGDCECFMSYTPEWNQWSRISRPRVNLKSGCAVVLGDRILLCGSGGYDDTTVIEKYNPVTDTWTELKPSLPQTDCRALFAVRL